MSRTTPPFGLDSSGHPPVEAISDYLEDLLPAEAAAELTRHLEGCPECLDTHAAIEEIRALLGQSEQVQLPGDIAVRIDAALAAEALLSSTEPTAAPEAAAAPLRTTGGSHPAGSSSGAAHGPSGSSAGSRGPGRKPRRGSARKLRRAALGLAALAVVGVVTVSLLQFHTDDSKSAGSAAVAGPQAAGGRSAAGAGEYPAFTDAALPEQVRQLVAARSGLGPKAATGSDGSLKNSPAVPNATAPVPACITLATHRGAEEPLTSTQGSYNSTPVYAVVYSGATDPLHSLDVYLVAASCTATATPTPGQVLLHRTVPRD